MSTIILLFTQSHARHALMSPQPRSELQLHLGVSEGAVVRIFSRDVIRWRYLRTYWSQIKPSQSWNSNTINECGVRRATARMCLTPIADSGMSWAYFYSDKSRHRVWHVTRDMMSRRMSSGTNQHWFAYRPCHRSLITSFCSPPAHRSGSLANGVFVLLSDVRY